MSVGCSALSKEQIMKVLESFEGTHLERNKLIFYVGISTGFRISEILSLKLEDVVYTKKDGRVLFPIVCKEEITVTKKNLKGGKKEHSSIRNRNVKINIECIEAIKRYVLAWKRMFSEAPLGSYPLFRSNKMKIVKSCKGEEGEAVLEDVVERKALSAVAARDILVRTFRKAGIYGRDREFSCHTMRKTYAQMMYGKLGRDLPMLQKALGHANINSTVQYLNIGAKDIKDASATMNDAFLNMESKEEIEKKMIILEAELPNWE